MKDNRANESEDTRDIASPVPSDDLRHAIVSFLQELSIQTPEDASSGELDCLLAHATELRCKCPEAGSIYTPPREVRMMCRLALAEWLAVRLSRRREELLRLMESGTLPDEAAQELQRAKILDPACGAGAFLIEMCGLLAHLTGRPFLDAAAQLYGTDSDALAVRAASLRLALRAGNETSARLKCVDSLAPGSLDEQFDIVIGNPPYVRQERISDPFCTLDSAQYKSLIRKWCEGLFQNARIDGRSDLCLYFFLRSLSLLGEGGICCLITSASWLDAEFGQSLRNLLADRFSLRLVIEREDARVFRQADVNPIIALVAADHHIDESAFISLDSGCCPRSVRLVSRKRLADTSGKWGALHLRASTLALEMMENGIVLPLAKHPLVRKIGRGIRTGCDRFFCLRRMDAENLGIEPEYLMPLVKSPQDFMARPPVAGWEEPWVLFVCSELPPKRSGARSYIERFEESSSVRSSPIKDGKHWWSIKPGESAGILLPVGFGERLFQVANSAGAAAHQRFATLYPEAGAELLLLAMLRCSIGLYFTELMGRRTLGQAALDIPPADWRLVPVPYIPPDRQEGPVRAIERLLKRPCLRIWDEVENEDHLLLDTEIAHALGIGEEVMKEFRRDLLELVRSRLARAGRQQAMRTA